MVIDPERVPPVVGVKVTANVQVLAAARLVPQVLVWAKSPLAATDEIVSAELPMFRSRTDCAALSVPTLCVLYASALGASATAGAELGPILTTKVSEPPPSTFWKAPWVVGKSVE